MQHIDYLILKVCTQKALEMSSPLLPNYKLVLYHLQHSQVSACVSDDMISLSLSPSTAGLFAGPCQAPQAPAQEDPSMHSARQTPQLGGRERRRQNCQADGRGLLL